LKKAQAERRLAKIELDAQTELVRRKVKAVREVDRWRARYDSTVSPIASANAQIDDARLAYTSQVNGENTTVARIRTDFDAALIDLEETTIYAPSDGYVTSLFARPGAVTLTTSFSSVMSFVHKSTVNVMASFPQSSIRHIMENDAAEIALDTQPGKIFRGQVVSIVPATAEGALSPSGDLMRASQAVQPGPIIVWLTIVDDLSDIQWTIGTAGAVAIYTEKGVPLRIIRKVIIRIYTWLTFCSDMQPKFAPCLFGGGG